MLRERSSTTTVLVPAGTRPVRCWSSPRADANAAPRSAQAATASTSPSKRVRSTALRRGLASLLGIERLRSGIRAPRDVCSHATRQLARRLVVRLLLRPGESSRRSLELGASPARDLVRDELERPPSVAHAVLAGGQLQEEKRMLDRLKPRSRWRRRRRGRRSTPRSRT